LTLSVIRRAEPASRTWSDAGCSSSASTSGDRERTAEHEPRSRLSRPDGVEPGEDDLLGLGSEPLELADPLLLGRPAQRVQRIDLELLEQPSRSLGAKSRQPRHLDQTRRELRAQLDQRRNLAGLRQRHHLFLDDRADPGQLGRPTVPRQAGDRNRRFAHRLGGIAVSDDPMDHSSVELVEVAQLVQRGGDLGVGGVSGTGRVGSLGRGDLC
jgi:hypothetical protein